MTTNNMVNVLFICTGNICRSPMAEYFFRSRLGSNSPWTAASAGLAAMNGLATSQTAIEVMDEIGINIRKHRSSELTDELVDAATIILVMTNAHAAGLKERFPGARDRVHLLGSFNKDSKEKEISDPAGASIEVYRRIRNDIAGCLDGLIHYLQSYQENKRQL